MIVVQATMWPRGNQAQSYELLHASINNKTELGDEEESYFAHVLSRPKPFGGILGYEADVEVRGHKPQDGFAPLLMAVLGAAYSTDQDASIIIPPARLIARLNLEDLAEFNKRITARQ